MIYISSDVIAECREAIRQGVPIATLAGKLGVTVAELQQAVGEPAWK